MKKIIKKIFKWIGIGFAVLLILGILMSDNGDSKDISKNKDSKETTSQKEEKKDFKIEISIDELFKDYKKYLNRDITVTGFCGWEAPKDENGNYSNYIFSEDWEHEIIVDDINKPMSGHVNVKVTGKLYKENNDVHIKATAYVIESTDETENKNDEQINELNFKEMQKACKRYSNMNWDTFYRNPESYSDNQYYYFVGKVIDVTGSGGLLQFVNNDTRTIVQYNSNGIAEGFLENDLVAVYAKVNSVKGSYTSGATGKTYECPSIYIEKYQRGETVLYTLSKEEKNLYMVHLQIVMAGIMIFLVKSLLLMKKILMDTHTQ